MEITSVTNDKVKFARSLARKKERMAAQQLLLEGTRLVQEASNAGFAPTVVFYERAAFRSDARLRQLVVGFQRGIDVHEVSEPVMRALSDTETPQGIAAIVSLPQLPIPSDPKLLLVVDRLRDPGNLGTILRTAWAANVAAVLLAPETADAFNPKVVRAAMGAHFHVPTASLGWDKIAERLASIPRVYLGDSEGALNYADADWTPPCALIVGGEAEGVSEPARALARGTISIPMPGHAESLNAAVATGILLFEAVRPRPAA